MSSQPLAIPNGNGGALDAVQPLANSVTGSPFSATTTAQATPALVGPGIVLYTSASVHLRFSAAGTAADTNDMIYPAGFYTFPVNDGDRLSMTAVSTATVYVERIRTVSDQP